MAALGYYGYRKYVKTPLEEKVNQKEAVLKGLAEQGYFLEGRAHDLEDQRHRQEHTASLLKQKFDEWHYELDQDHFKAQEETRVCAVRTAERIATKNIYIAEHAWAKKIEPALIADAQKKLEQKYADHTQSKDYVHEIVARLKKDQQ